MSTYRITNPYLYTFLSNELDDIVENVRNGNIDVTYGLTPSLGWALSSFEQHPEQHSLCGADDASDVDESVAAALGFMTDFMWLIASEGADSLIIDALDAADQPVKDFFDVPVDNSPAMG